MSKDLYFEMRQEELAHFLTDVENGKRNALTLYGEIKRHKELYTLAEKQIEPYAIEEACNYAEKTFQYDGFEFSKRNGSTRFSFKNIPEWQEVEQAKKEIEEKHKQAFLSKQKGLLIASEDGEEIILPEVSYTKEILTVKKL